MNQQTITQLVTMLDGHVVKLVLQINVYALSKYMKYKLT